MPAPPAAVGDPSSFIYVTQPQVPKRPYGMQIINVGDRKISVSWIDQSDNEDGFSVRFHGRRAGFSDHTGSKYNGRNEVSASLTGLFSGNEYTINVVTVSLP